MKRSFDVVITRDPGGGYTASVPALPGCHTQGRTLRELRSHVKEAILLCLDDPEPFEARFVGVERVDVEA